MNIERALKTNGWMSEVELVYLAHLAMSHIAILEIGSWQGRSAHVLADNTKGVVCCVDTWADNAYGNAPAEMTCHPEWLWNQFSSNHSENLKSGKVIATRQSSVCAKDILAAHTFDMIFIDAGHNYEDVRADLLTWMPALRPGGVLCGHDLYPDGPHHPGVLQAVNEFVPKYRVFGTIWSTEGL